MKRTYVVFQITFTSLILLLLFHTTFSKINAIASGNTSYSGQSLPDDRRISSEDILKLKETTIQQRDDLIKYLLNTIKSNKGRYDITFAAIDIMGQIRAIDAADYLLDIIDYRLPFMSMSLPSIDPNNSGKLYPVVKALVSIRPAYENILNKVQNENSIIKIRCYIAVIVGVEGLEVSRYLFKEAVKKELDYQKKDKLTLALNIINEEFPQDNNNVKQK
jgi:hypothetical protein